MRDAEEERTGSAPVAGAVSTGMRTDMSNAVEERTGSAPVGEVAS